MCPEVPESRLISKRSSALGQARSERASPRSTEMMTEDAKFALGF
jgi:hypothetical protein